VLEPGRKSGPVHIFGGADPLSNEEETPGGDDNG